MQSRFSSLIEQFCNVGSGFILSLLIWVLLVTPLYGIEVNWSANLQITAIFTIASIIRGYFWRRLFNKRLEK